MHALTGPPELSTLERSWRIAAHLARLLWSVIRLPLFALLVILEPIVRLLLAAGALLIMLTAIFYAIVRPEPHAPVLGMLGVAVGLFLLLALYYGILRVLRG